jgi:serine/threonine-protein kinase
MAANVVGDLDRGRRIGKYELLTRLSVGGMAELYLAFLPGPGGFKKFVALKQILPDVVADEAFVRMFLDEARITAAFAHPNIGQVFDLGEDPHTGDLYLAMEFIPGQNLEQVIRRASTRQVAMPIGFAARVVRDACLGLHYAHTFTDPTGQPMAVVHRDVSPKNVMVTYGGQVKMIDFGIAKARGRLNRTQVGIVKGTTGYMAPEQVKNEPLDGRTDLFASGVILHELLCGERLFRAATDMATMVRIVQEEPRDPSRLNPGVSAELAACTLKALAKPREVRFGTGKDFARALEQSCPELFDDEQVADFMATLFEDKIAATRALLDVAKEGSDAGQMSQAALGLTGADGAEGRPRKTPAPRPPVRASAPRLAKVATGAQRARAPSGGTGKAPRLSRPSKQELPPVGADLPGTVPPKARGSSRRLPTVPPAPPTEVADETAKNQLAVAGGSLAGPFAAMGVLVVLAVAGWAAAFGPLRGQAEALFAADAEPVVDLGPRPIDLTVSATSAKPGWLLEQEREKQRLAEQRARQEEIERAANDPVRQKQLREYDAQLRQLDKLEAEQRLLRAESLQGRATGEANTKRIDDLQRQIDALNKAMSAGKPGGAKTSADDPERVDIIRDDRSAKLHGTGFLTLHTSNPPSAAVFLGGDSLGSTPLRKTPLEAGVHRLRVVDGDSRDRVLSVQIEAGKTTEFFALDVGSLPLAP